MTQQFLMKQLQVNLEEGGIAGGVYIIVRAEFNKIPVFIAEDYIQLQGKDLGDIVSS